MGEYLGRRDFRSGRVGVTIAVLPTLLFAAGAAMTYRDRGWNWVSAGLACATLFGVAGIVESMVFRVLLTEDALFVTNLLGRQRYPVANITGVAEGKGMPTMLLLADGRKVRLPPVGSNMGNSIRAWLRHFTKE